MRIRFLSPKSYTVAHPDLPPDFGGAEVQMYLLAREMSKSTQDAVELWVADYGQDRLEQDGQLWLRNAFPGPAVGGISRLARLTKLFFEFVFRRAEVVIQRTLTPWTWFLALLTRLKGAKFVYMVAHDNEVSTRGCLQRAPTLRQCTRCIRSLLSFRLSHLVVTQNRYQTTRMSRTFSRKTFELNSSISLRRAPDIGASKGFVLWVGRNAPKKRAQLFLQLAHRLPQYRFVMICPHGQNAHQNAQLEKDATRTPNVEFIPGIAYAQIDRFFRHARILVNTSTAEGFPNTFLQAANNATAIVSLNVDPGGMLFEHRVGSVCFGDFELLIEETKSLMEDEQRWREKVEAAWSYVRNYHDTKKNAANIHRRLSQLVCYGA